MLSKILLSKTIQKRPTSKSRSLLFILIGGVKCHTENFYPVYGFAPFPALFDDILIITQFPIIVNNQFICLRQNHIGTPLLVPPCTESCFLPLFHKPAYFSPLCFRPASSPEVYPAFLSPGMYLLLPGTFSSPCK